MTFRKGTSGGAHLPAAPITPVRGRLFGARQAGQYLGITENLTRTLVRQGELLAVRTPGGRLRGIYEADCDAWMAQHRGPAPAIQVRPSVDERIKHLLPATRHFS